MACRRAIVMRTRPLNPTIGREEELLLEKGVPLREKHLENQYG
jgi:hypothetical protein